MKSPEGEQNEVSSPDFDWMVRFLEKGISGVTEYQFKSLTELLTTFISQAQEKGKSLSQVNTEQIKSILDTDVRTATGNSYFRSSANVEYAKIHERVILAKIAFNDPELAQKIID